MTVIDLTYILEFKINIPFHDCIFKLYLVPSPFCVVPLLHTVQFNGQ